MPGKSCATGHPAAVRSIPYFSFSGSSDYWNRKIQEDVYIKSQIGRYRVRGYGGARELPHLSDLAFARDISLDAVGDDPVEAVRMRTRIGGKNGANSLDLSMPVLIAPMSYGALSRSAKQAVAIASGKAGIAENTGEGGMSDAQRDAAGTAHLPDARGAVWAGNIHDMNRADGLEIYISQGAKPGFGGQLMAKKVTKELAEIRGIPAGIDLRSPSRHPDILGADDLVIKVEELREATGYRLPVSVKLGAGRIHDDIKIAVKDGFDFVELDGMQGSTGAGGTEVMEYVGIPTIAAICEAERALASIGRRNDIEIVLMGGLRDGIDAVKAMCLGADAVALGTAAIIAGGCIACMQCHVGAVRDRNRDPGSGPRDALQATDRGPEHLHVPGERPLADCRDYPRPGIRRCARTLPRRPCRTDARSGRDYRTPLSPRAPGFWVFWHGCRNGEGPAMSDSGANLLPPELEDDTGDGHFVPAPCQIACPVGTDAPSYIAYIWEEKFDEAFEAITATNPFSSICGRVCDAPCEPACRRTASDGPLQIRNLKRFVMERLGATWKPQAAPVTRKESVGIVGAGPAGLVAAHDLAVAGFKVDVYEMTDRPGGMMIWGIPEFRLPPGTLREDMDRLQARCPGLTIHTNIALGRDITLEELKQRHDAVGLTIGSWWGKTMGIPGEDDGRVIDGVEFLRRVNTGERPQMPSTVVVIGGGDVSMDACRSALRLPGCEYVKVIYRRGPEEIPARRIELEGAIEEGIEFIYNTQQIEVISDNEDALRLRCVRTEAGEPDQDGRRRPVTVPGSGARHRLRHGDRCGRPVRCL